MKNYTLLSLFLAFSFLAKAQDSLYMKKHFQWKDETLYFNTYFGIKQYYNEIWGWANPNTGEEFAVIGAADGTYFFDVTNPDSCYMADYVPAKDRAEIHRDYKTYGNYVYMVADEGNNSLQIYDMTTLPDTATLVYDSDTFVINSHNIFIDEGILYMVTPNIPGGGGPNGLRLLDLAADPTNPTLLADFILPPGQGSHVHDLYVRDSIAYTSNGNAGLFIYDMSDPNNGQYIASMETYTEQGYNHNSWMSDDGSTLYFTDETLGMGVKALDISDLQNLNVATIFRSNVGAMAHNALVKGDSLYVSYYHDGVYVFDITDPTNPVAVAYYDTFEEQTGYNDYQGAWGVYPFLPSGTLLVSDFENGLFVLSFDSTAGPVDGQAEAFNGIVPKAYPNPAQNTLRIKGIHAFPDAEVNIVNSLGATVPSSQVQKISTGYYDISGLKPGVYYLRVYENGRHFASPFRKE